MGSQVAPPGAEPRDGERGGSPAKKFWSIFCTGFNGNQAFSSVLDVVLLWFYCEDLRCNNKSIRSHSAALHAPCILMLTPIRTLLSFS